MRLPYHALHDRAEKTQDVPGFIGLPYLSDVTAVLRPPPQGKHLQAPGMALLPLLFLFKKNRASRASWAKPTGAGVSYCPTCPTVRHIPWQAALYWVPERSITRAGAGDLLHLHQGRLGPLPAMLMPHNHEPQARGWNIITLCLCRSHLWHVASVRSHSYPTQQDDVSHATY